jgi:hypothetical protein
MGSTCWTEPRTAGGHVTVTVQDHRPIPTAAAATSGLALAIRPLDDSVLGDTVAKFSRCGTQLYVNTSCPREDQLWAIGEALDHLRGLPALGAQEVQPLRWSRSAVILPY